MQLPPPLCGPASRGKEKESGAGIGCKLTHALNGNNSLSPPKRGEGWGEGFVLLNIGLLSPALSSLREAREKNSAGVKMRPAFRRKTTGTGANGGIRHPFCQ
jgi:hypothetical protein